VLKKTIPAFIILIALTVFSIFYIRYLKTFLFLHNYLLLIIPVVTGTLGGLIKSSVKKTSKPGGQIKVAGRHTLSSFLEHWATSVGIILLLISGYDLKASPSISASNLHFWGLLLTLLFAFYFFTDFILSQKYRELLPNVNDVFDGTIKKYLLRFPWKDFGKYKASQKTAFLAFIILGADVLISGIIKIIASVVTLNESFLRTVNLVHDISGLLLAALIAVHIIMIPLTINNIRLLISWFTGNEVKNTLK
jgi:cytochrome b subunit of formate dehydrogenase